MELLPPADPDDLCSFVEHRLRDDAIQRLSAAELVVLDLRDRTEGDDRDRLLVLADSLEATMRTISQVIVAVEAHAAAVAGDRDA